MQYSKLDIANDFDNNSSLQHEACALAGYEHSTDAELGKSVEERSEKKIKCFAFDTNSREFHAVTWNDIAEAIEEDEEVKTLRNSVAQGNWKLSS